MAKAKSMKFACALPFQWICLRQGPTKAAPSHHLPWPLLPFLSTMYTIAIQTGIPGIIQIDLRFSHMSAFSRIFPLSRMSLPIHMPEYYFFPQDIPQSLYKKLSPTQGGSGATLYQLAKTNCYIFRNVWADWHHIGGLKLAMVKIWIPWKLVKGTNQSFIPRGLVAKHLPVYHCQCLLTEFILLSPRFSWPSGAFIAVYLAF